MGEDRDLEAAGWTARLRTRSLGNAELREFAEWRRLPGSAEAYDRAERLWRSAGPLEHDPDVAAALEGALARRPRAARRALAAAALATLLLALVAGVVLRREAGGLSYRTAVGERSSAILPDGSRLIVDADSDVRVRLTGGERRVVLRRGQALFAVAHDPGRPFVVEAPSGVTVTALGTRFDVEARADGGVAVALLDGRIAVDRHGGRLAVLVAGETLLVPREGGPVGTRGGAGEAAGWTSGRLTFRDDPLAAAVSEMNRYSAPRIVVVDAAASSERLSGEFSVDDPDGFVRGVNALLGRSAVARDGPG